MGVLNSRIGFWSFIYKDVKFQMFSDEGENVLVELILPRSPGDVPEVFIPHELHSGERIDSLGRKFCSGRFSKIIIEDDIVVKPEAFLDAEVEEVVWPKNCTVIPELCFYRSSIERITNVDNVVSVGESAFEKSRITEFSWPSACEIIPPECFKESALQRLSNTDHVTEIGDMAFERCEITEFSWPPKCTRIPEKCFRISSLEKLSNIDHVTEIGASAFEFASLDDFTWPQACKIIPTYCFYGASLKTISNINHVVAIEALAFCNVAPVFSVDLSDSAILGIAPLAFLHCNPQNVKLPYYVLESETFTTGD